VNDVVMGSNVVSDIGNAWIMDPLFLNDELILVGAPYDDKKE
jgi:hypothetical protein